MEVVAALAGIAAFVGAWWWGNQVAKKSGWRAVSRHVLGASLAVVAFLCVAMLLMPAPSPDGIAEQAALEAASTAEKHSFSESDHLDVSAYVSRFRAALDGIIEADSVVVEPRSAGAVNDTQSIAVDSNAVVLQLDKRTGDIVGIIAIVQGTGEADSGARAVAVGMAALAAAAAPADAQAVSNAALTLFASYDGSQAAKSRVAGLDITYEFSELTGGMFTASPIDAGS